MPVKNLIAKWAGHCSYCAIGFSAGTKVAWDSTTKAVYHQVCYATVLQGKGMPVVGMGQPAVLKPTLKPIFKATVLPKSPSLTPKLVPVLPVEPKTQKARGITVLQGAGMLSKAYARVGTTLDEAKAAAKALGYPNFCRPCPKFPRHGFVDSRVVKSEADLIQVWEETKAADPEGEVVCMPFIDATHNMVWTPGLLSIGPGHDGATAGHQSVSVFLQNEYSGEWKTLAEKAGVKLESQDPFIEAVAQKKATETGGTIVTQIRGGAKGQPTEPDWNPYPGMTVGGVVVIDQAKKAEPGYMLAWEEIAKGLKKGVEVVYNPGGNLADHFSVHARLAEVSVITSFQPKVGQTLPKLGVDLVPLEPMAVVWGYLAGLLWPGMRDDGMTRQRALTAAILGTHHGLQMGGESGVFLGVSIGLLLRLSQAICWGEARHAEHTGISRNQVYRDILDDWQKGRAGFGKKVSLFHTHHWAGGFGGKAWAGIGHAAIELDRVMLDLVKTPSIVHAKEAVGKLTTAVNVAHNNGWAFNKFMTSTVFDQCAALDPRPCLMAGPVWYDAVTKVGEGDRIRLLEELEGMSPIEVGHKSVPPKTKKSKAGTTGYDLSADPAGIKAMVDTLTHGKQGNFNAVPVGGVVHLAGAGPVTGARCKQSGMDSLHVQIETGQGYYSGPVTGVSLELRGVIEALPEVVSLSGSGVAYRQLTVTGGAVVSAGETVLATVQTDINQ